jgi:AbiU2
MNIDDQKIVSLKEKVRAAREEFDLAVAFHEAWKPAAYDEDLRTRIGRSYAANTFLVVRAALRREMLLALMRLWDKSPGGIRMDSVGATLRDKHVIAALAADRAVRMRVAESEDQMRRDLEELARAAVAIISKYESRGTVREKLKRLRDERLAHRQTDDAAVAEADATSEEIEAFYQDMSDLIGLLLTVAMATSYDPRQHALVCQHHARFLWASVRGERTEGHPNYRPKH